METALDHIEGRRRPLLVWHVFWGPRAFGELLRSTDGTKKTLRIGFVTKRGTNNWHGHAGGTELTLRVECFNVFNSNTELNRVVNASSTAFNRLEEIMSPRIFRLGATPRVLARGALASTLGAAQAPGVRSMEGHVHVLTAREVRRLALALPETDERSRSGRPSFRVGGRIFATLTRGGSARS